MSWGPSHTVTQSRSLESCSRQYLESGGGGLGREGAGECRTPGAGLMGRWQGQAQAGERKAGLFLPFHHSQYVVYGQWGCLVKV